MGSNQYIRRNKLEHNLLILKYTHIQTPGTLNIFDDENFVVVAGIGEFKEKTLQLLQLTRAAIISFVYCVRLETITHASPDAVATHTIHLK